MAAPTDKATANAQLKAIETALGPVVVALSDFTGADETVTATPEEVPYPILQSEATSLYHSVTVFLGHLRTREIIEESKKASG